MWSMIYSIDVAGDWESVSLAKESQFLLLPCSAALSAFSIFRLFLGNPVLSDQVKLSWEHTPGAECFFVLTQLQICFNPM